MKAGQNHTLTVSRISDYGLYLADAEGQEVLLPNRYVSLSDKVGDTRSTSSSTTTPKTASWPRAKRRWHARARPHS